MSRNSVMGVAQAASLHDYSQDHGNDADWKSALPVPTVASAMRPYPSQKKNARRGVVAGISFLLVAASLSFSGCATYEDDAKKMMGYWQTGSYTSAAEVAKDEAEDAGSTNRLLWQLEWGATERAAGRFAESRKAFDMADATVADWDKTPDVSLSREFLSSLTNMSSLAYRGTAYDRIMLSTYQALNYLSLGDSDKARVALNQALERQADAVHANAGRIEKVEEEAKAARSGSAENSYNVEQAKQDGKVQEQLAANYGELVGMNAYTDYVNPFSVWLHGVYFMANASGTSEVERAYKSLERVAGMSPQCTAVKEDFALVRKMRDGGKSPEGVTYVIFETGLAPSRREIRIDIPLFIVSEAIPYVGAAFPKLNFNGSYSSVLMVSGGGGEPVRTETVANMDNVIATDFHNDLPEIITRSLVSTGIKATATYFINHATRKNYERDTGNLGNTLLYVATLVGTSVYSAATTRADLRTWLTLPKEFQVARLTTPEDRKLHLVSGQSTAVDVTVIPGSVTVVYVKTIGVNTPLIVSQFVLKP